MVNFRKFITSSGKLVLGGKSAENNEQLIKQAEAGEVVLHTKAPGSPFVNIILEGRDGATQSADSFTIVGSTSGVGWGFDKWGTIKWGNTLGAGSASGSNDLAKRTRVNKIGRTVQLEITTTGNNDQYELLAIQIQAQELGPGIIPSSWNTE